MMRYKEEVNKMNNIIPEISVIIPIYNAENSIDKCVNSIVNQTYSNLEIILIDDGSTDDSMSICRKWEKKDNRICYFTKENGGVSSARNYGIKKAKGNRLVFVDADDWLDLNTFKYIMDNFESYDMVVWNSGSLENGKLSYKSFTQKMYVANSSEELAQMKKYAFAGENEKGQDFYMGLLNICNKSIKRDIFTYNELYFNENLNNHEDFLLALEVLEHIKNAVIIDKPFYFRQYRQGSLSHSFNLTIRENNKQAYLLMDNFIRRYYSDDIWYQNSVNQYYSYWFMQILLKNYFCKESRLSFWNAYKKTKNLINEMPYCKCFNYKLKHTSKKKKILNFLGKYKLCFSISCICAILRK